MLLSVWGRNDVNCGLVAFFVDSLYHKHAINNHKLFIHEVWIWIKLKHVPQIKRI